MWMPAHTTVAARRGGAQRGRDELADRREDDRGVERLGAGRHRVAGPLGAELSASAWAASSSARVNANTRRPSCTATWQMMCAAAPKP